MSSPGITRCAIPLLILLIIVPPGTPARASESSRPVRVKLHWNSAQGRFEGTGNALEVVGDTLLMDRLVTFRQGTTAGEGLALMPHVNLPDMQRIEVSYGTRSYGRRGAGVGFGLGALLGAVASASVASDPFLGGNAGAMGLTILGSGLLFAAIGAGVGAAMHVEQWKPVHADSLRALMTH